MTDWLLAVELCLQSLVHNTCNYNMSQDLILDFLLWLRVKGFQKILLALNSYHIYLPISFPHLLATNGSPMVHFKGKMRQTKWSRITFLCSRCSTSTFSCMIFKNIIFAQIPNHLHFNWNYFWCFSSHCTFFIKYQLVLEIGIFSNTTCDNNARTSTMSILEHPKFPSKLGHARPWHPFCMTPTSR